MNNNNNNHHKYRELKTMCNNVSSNLNTLLEMERSDISLPQQIYLYNQLNSLNTTIREMHEQKFDMRIVNNIQKMQNDFRPLYVCWMLRCIQENGEYDLGNQQLT